jgi:type I restriction enzyme, S subunit
MRPISETGKYINGLAFKPTDWGESGMPIVRIQNLTDRDKPMNRTTRAVDSAYVVERGDLLVSWSATLDAFIWDREPALLNQHIFKVVPNEDLVLRRYLYLALQNAIKEMRATEHVHGSTMKHINRGPFLAHRIPVPSREEQARIVAELEKQFSRLKRVKANIKRYKAAVLKAAVDGRLVSHRSITDAEAPAEQGPSAQSELPPRWRWSAVGELAHVGTGSTPNRSKGAYWTDGDIPWVTSAAVNEPYVDSAAEFVTRAALAETNLTVYPPGTLLVAMYGEGKTRGKCTELRIAATTNQALAALQVTEDLRPYLKLFLDHSYEDMRRLASGGVQPNLNLGLVRTLRIPVPPRDDRQRIVAEVGRRLSIVREGEAEVDVNLKRAQALRQAVLSTHFQAHSRRGS